jgi:hypothetical protein
MGHILCFTEELSRWQIECAERLVELTPPAWRYKEVSMVDRAPRKDWTGGAGILTGDTFEENIHHRRRHRHRADGAELPGGVRCDVATGYGD